MSSLYMDCAATTMLPPEIHNKMNELWSKDIYGNPSSIHTKGIESWGVLTESRGKIASVIKAQPNNIIFTSGGTESNNLAIIGTALHERFRGNHIITSQIEHPSVLNACKMLEEFGFEVTYLPVDEFGMIDYYDFTEAIRPTTILASIMMVNNEIGTIQDIRWLAKLAHEHNILFHTDAVQGYGHLDIDVKKLGIDLMSVSGHKFYAPNGVGFLYVNTDKIEPIIYGGGQENGLRSGTENVQGIYGMAEATRYITLLNTIKEPCGLREYFINELFSEIDNIKLNGGILDNSRYIINIFVEGVKASALVINLNNNGLYVSAGSACHSDSDEPSHVLKAIGLSDEEALSSIRISYGIFTTIKDIDEAVQIIKKCVEELRGV